MDGEGNTTTDIFTVVGRLSDCHPIVSNGTVIWYVTGGGTGATAPYFCTISADGNYAVHSTLESPNITGSSVSTAGVEVTWDIADEADGYYVYYSSDSDSGYVKVTDGNSTSTIISISDLTSGSSYKIWMEAYSGTIRSLPTEKETFYYLDAPAIMLTETENGVLINWDAVTGAEGYLIFHRTAGKNDTLIGMTTDTYWFDIENTATEGDDYLVCAYYDSCIGLEYMFSVLNTSEGLQVTFDAIEGTEYYNITYQHTSYTSTYVQQLNKANGDVSDDFDTYTKIITNDKQNSGDIYTIYVKAYTSSGTVTTNTVTIMYLSQPVPLMSGSRSEPIVTWEAVKGAESYQIYRRTAESDWVALECTTETSYTDTTADAEMVYYYTVQAVSGYYRSSSDTEGVSTSLLENDGSTGSDGTDSGSTGSGGSDSGSTDSDAISGADTLVVRRDGNIYYFSDSITDPNAGVTKVSYGRSTDEVLVGDWDGDGI
ncbi:MAG: fibronectin type III domain-containing protein, partial [Clostridiales bacterium]|nr:fibronectin type III domain-containing protein [Clostridiales bacterium]